MDGVSNGMFPQMPDRELPAATISCRPGKDSGVYVGLEMFQPIKASKRLMTEPEQEALRTLPDELHDRDEHRSDIS